MILCIAQVLEGADLEEIRAAIRKGRFEDGARTAGWHARMVKRNSQLAGEVRQRVEGRIRKALDSNALLRSAALPRRIGPLLISRYAEGMEYGAHVDDAVMGLDAPGGPLRSDMSFTLFLSDPTDYDGGELVMEATGQDQVYKLEAGALILYPSTSLHRVQPVSRGERLAAVGWIQSLVRDPAAREILFDLDTARHGLFREEGKSAAFDLVSKSYSNLLRRWAEI